MRRMGSIVSALVLGVLTLSSAALSAENFDLLLADLELIPLPAATPPAFKLETLDGEPLALADVRGRVALRYFWATW